MGNVSWGRLAKEAVGNGKAQDTLHGSLVDANLDGKILERDGTLGWDKFDDVVSGNELEVDGSVVLDTGFMLGFSLWLSVFVCLHNDVPGGCTGARGDPGAAR